MKLEGKFDGIQTHLFPTPRNNSRKGNKMAFKLVVKDAQSKYNFTTGKTKNVDRVEKFDDLAVALSEFLYVVTDEYGDDEVSLVFKRSKKDKK